MTAGMQVLLRLPSPASRDEAGQHRWAGMSVQTVLTAPGREALASASRERGDHAPILIAGG